MIHKWKTQWEGGKIKLSQSSTKQIQNMRWKMRENTTGGPVQHLLKRRFQGEENKVEKKQRKDSRKFPRTEGMNFQTRSHMFFRRVRIKTEPHHSTSSWNFRVKKVIHKVSKIFTLCPLLRELPKDGAQLSKRNIKRDPRTRWSITEQKQTGSQDDDGWPQKTAKLQKLTGL